MQKPSSTRLSATHLFRHTTEARGQNRVILPYDEKDALRFGSTAAATCSEATCRTSYLSSLASNTFKVANQGNITPVLGPDRALYWCRGCGWVSALRQRIYTGRKACHFSEPWRGIQVLARYL